MGSNDMDLTRDVEMGETKAMSGGSGSGSSSSGGDEPAKPAHLQLPPAPSPTPSWHTNHSHSHKHHHDKLRRESTTPFPPMPSMAGASFDGGSAAAWDDSEPVRRAPLVEWLDGFKRAERRSSGNIGWSPSGTSATGPYGGGYRRNTGMDAAGDRVYNIHAATAKMANTPLARDLKSRHLQMIAFGGAIGTGLFVSSGQSLYIGGPATVLLSYFIMGLLQYCTMQSLGELCVIFPVPGSFSVFSTRFLDPSWGFAMGWNYGLQWLVCLPIELIAGAFTINYWNEHVNKSIFVGIFLFSIALINLFGVKAYGEAEFIFSIIKVTAVIGFILLGIVINVGGPPDSGYIGGSYWHTPGPFVNGFRGFCSVLVASAFAFTGTELIGLAAAEAANPRKSMPSAIKQVFWRITVFYIVALALVGLLVPSDDPRLVMGKSTADASASPFVIAIESAGTTVLPSVMNAIILVAVISVGNSAVFGSSRTLLALAEQSHAPRIFGYVDRRGRPLVAIALALAVGLMAFMVELSYHNTFFDWLVSISALSVIITWTSICLCHIRFRQAWAYQGRPLDQLPFRSHVGVLGAWTGFIGYIIVVGMQIWVAADPVRTPELNSSTSGLIQNFCLRVLALPILLIFYICHKLWFRTKIVRVDEMDIETGRRYFRIHITNEQERDERMAWPFWKRMYHSLC